MIYRASSIFHYAHPKIITVTLTFLNLHQHAKNQLNSWATAGFRVPRLKRPRPFLTITIQKLLKKLPAFLNLKQNLKLLPILTVIRHLICGNNLNWLLNLNLIYKTLDWGKKWLAFQCWENSAGFVWPV